MRFTRPRLTGDSQDMQFNRSFYFLFAWDGSVMEQQNVTVLGRHQNRQIDDSKSLSLSLNSSCSGKESL